MNRTCTVLSLRSCLVFRPRRVRTVSRNRTPGNNFAPSETHTPGSRLQQRGARYYSPELGRWLSRDPIGEAGFSLTTRRFKKAPGSRANEDRPVSRAGDRPKDEVNLGSPLLYVFVVNSPVNLIDPFGLLPGSPYATADAAAIAAVAEYVSGNQLVERGGAVYWATNIMGAVWVQVVGSDGETYWTPIAGVAYSYVPAVVGSAMAVNTAANNGLAPAGSVIVGYWHSHTCIGSGLPPGGFSQPDQTLIAGFTTGIFWLKDIYHSNLWRWKKAAGQPDVYGLLP